jgi:hypothetical protein
MTNSIRPRLVNVREVEVHRLARVKETLPGTDSGLRPGDFPLGSVQSRAVTRAELEHRQKQKEEADNVIRVRIIAVGSGEVIELWPRR